MAWCLPSECGLYLCDRLFPQPCVPVGRCVNDVHVKKSRSPRTLQIDELEECVLHGYSCPRCPAQPTVDVLAVQRRDSARSTALDPVSAERHHNICGVSGIARECPLGRAGIHSNEWKLPASGFSSARQWVRVTMWSEAPQEESHEYLPVTAMPVRP